MVAVDVQVAAAGERIGLDGETAEIRRVLSPRDGEWLVEYDADPADDRLSDRAGRGDSGDPGDSRRRGVR